MIKKLLQTLIKTGLIRPGWIIVAQCNQGEVYQLVVITPSEVIFDNSFSRPKGQGDEETLIIQCEAERVRVTAIGPGWARSETLSIQ